MLPSGPGEAKELGLGTCHACCRSDPEQRGTVVMTLYEVLRTQSLYNIDVFAVVEQDEHP